MTKKTNTLTQIALMAALQCIVSPFAIVFPISPVPVSLATLMLYLSVYVLGKRYATVSYGIYLLIGLVGIPVFSGFRGGIGALLGNTGGYLVGYVFLALVVWGMEKWTRNRKWLQVLSMVLGLALCYAFGTIWFIVMYAQSSGVIGLSAVLGWCVLPYVIPDLIKLGLAMGLSGRLRGIISKGDSN